MAHSNGSKQMTVQTAYEVGIQNLKTVGPVPMRLHPSQDKPSQLHIIVPIRSISRTQPHLVLVETQIHVPSSQLVHCITESVRLRSEHFLHSLDSLLQILHLALGYSTRGTHLRSIS